MQSLIKSNTCAHILGEGQTNFYDKNLGIYTAITEQIRKTPNNIALTCGHQSLTYQQLDDHVNRLACFLIDVGVQEFDRVALYLEPELGTVVSILAILKIGACYVPLDTTYPIDRLNYMLSDSGASALITQSNLAKKLAAKHTRIQVLIDQFFSKNLPNRKIDDRATGNHLAYIIYTSGSTGKPKGVEVRHQSINNHMIWMKNQFSIGPDDRVLLKTPLSFDPSVWEILLPLYVGAELVIAPEGTHLNSKLLIKVIQDHRITVIQLVPTLLYDFLNQKEILYCKSLRHVFSGGETLPPKTKELFFNVLHCQLHNLYGPTEATIQITSHTVNANDFDIHTNLIGKPIYNVQLYVVNADMQLATVGEEGELYIAGDCLAQGYHNKLQFTQEKFIDNPFNSEKHPKAYRTGDLVKWIDRHNLEYIGRKDNQLKINGARVDLGEIRSAILTHPTVHDCVILKKTNTQNFAYLICYLVLKENKEDIEFNIQDIKESLFTQLPSYMLPKYYITIPKIPVTINGKLDIAALPEPQPNFNCFHQLPKTIDKAMTKEEKVLLTIWQEVLGSSIIRVEDSFFEAGGHSLMALELLMKIEEKFTVTLHIRDIFLYPTLEKQAKLIQNILHNNYIDEPIYLNSIITLQSYGEKTPLFLIHPIGGTVFWYSGLAKYMGNDRPLYGIQDPSIENEVTMLNSIEEMAKFYVGEIKKIQPTGPYLIGGASFGATVAIEMANILNGHGEAIAAILVLDGWGIYPDTLLDNDYFIESMKRQQAALQAEFKKYGIKNTDNLLKVQWHRLSLLWRYKLKKIKNPFVLFKATEILPAFAGINDTMNHWNQFVSKEAFLCYEVPGNHETMFQEPNVQVLSKELYRYLEEAAI